MVQGVPWAKNSTMNQAAMLFVSPERMSPVCGSNTSDVRKLGPLILALGFLGGCSDVGPGVAHHPLDCALGFAWGDCLPGTPGYARQPHTQTVYWAKPDQSPQAFAQDKYACMMDARTPVSNGSITGGMAIGNTYIPAMGSSRSGEIISQEMVSACMEAKGYTQQ